MTPEHAARDVLDALGVRAPEEIDVELIAAALGAYVVPKARRGEGGLAATLVRAGDRALIGVDAASLDTGRGRFSIAHELGHFVLHEGRDPISACAAVDLDGRGRLHRDERHANEFARELLMPAAMFAPRCSTRTSLEELRDLAALFQASLVATAMRATQVGPAKLAVVISERGVVRWSMRAKSFPFGVRRGLRLGRGAFASAPEALDYHLAKGAAERVRAEEFGGRRGHVEERSIRSGQQVMSVLLAID